MYIAHLVSSLHILFFSIEICEDSMKSDDDFSQEEIISEIALLDLLIGFCYILLNDYKKAALIYDNLHKNDCLTDPSRKLIMLNNRLCINYNNSDNDNNNLNLQEEVQLYNNLFKQKIFSDLSKISFNKQQMDEKSENSNYSKLNNDQSLIGVFENEQTKAAHNKHLILLQNSAELLIEEKKKEKEKEKEKEREKQKAKQKSNNKNKGKNKNKNKNRNQNRNSNQEEEKADINEGVSPAEKVRQMAWSVVGLMRSDNPSSEMPLWLKIAPKYNTKQYRACQDILKVA